MSGFPSDRRLKGCAGACADIGPGKTRSAAKPITASPRANLFVEAGCVLFVYMTLVLIKPGVFFGVAVEGNSDRPWLREDFRIFDGRLVDHRVRRCFGVTL